MNYQPWLLGVKFNFLTFVGNHISRVLIKHFRLGGGVRGVCFTGLALPEAVLSSAICRGHAPSLHIYPKCEAR